MSADGLTTAMGPHETLCAGIALLALIGDAEDGGEVYAIASHEDQAKIVFNQASAMVTKSAVLAEHLVPFKTSIYCPALNAAFKPLSGKAEGKHGLNCSGLIGDEVHEWKDGDLYQFVHDSESARRQPLEFLISTAGKKGLTARSCRTSRSRSPTARSMTRSICCRHSLSDVFIAPGS
jgi:phage terminase large subunit-like protein